MRRTRIPQYYTTAEVAGLMKVHWQTVLDLIKAKRLKALKVGRNYRISHDDLQTYLGENSTIKVQPIENE